MILPVCFLSSHPRLTNKTSNANTATKPSYYLTLTLNVCEIKNIFEGGEKIWITQVYARKHDVRNVPMIF